MYPLKSGSANNKPMQQNNLVPKIVQAIRDNDVHKAVGLAKDYISSSSQNIINLKNAYGTLKECGKNNREFFEAIIEIETNDNRLNNQPTLFTPPNPNTDKGKLTNNTHSAGRGRAFTPTIATPTQSSGRELSSRECTKNVPNGDKVTELPNGNIVTKFANGDIGIKFPTGITVTIKLIDGKASDEKTLEFKDGGKYIGTLDKNFLRDGKGMMIYPNKCTYEGDWKEGSCHGTGRYIDPIKKFLYTGDFVNGKGTGKATVNYYGTGSMYEGEVVNGKPNGIGKKTTKGCTYEGSFLNGKENGYGVSTFPDRSKYDGNFVEGEFNGEGTFTFNNIFEETLTFKGTFKNGYPINITYHCINGDVFTGKFDNEALKNYLMNGNGVIERPNEYKYTGDIKNDVPEGNGIMEFANKDFYEGQFKDGKPHGQGKYKYANDDIYDGEFICGIRVGKGKLVYANYSVYDGEFKNDKPHGDGTFIDANKDKYVGQLICGKRNGIFTIMDKNGTERSVRYMDDILIEEMPSVSQNIPIINNSTASTMDTKLELNPIYSEFAYDGGQYKGYSLNAIPEGKGLMNYANGDIYEGEFVGGVVAGNGKYIWVTGDAFEGYFVNGVMSDNGIYTPVKDDSIEEQPQTGNTHTQDQYDDFICNVEDTVQFDSKLISNSQAPEHIIKEFKLWVNSINTNGIITVRQSRGYHDEPLNGKLKGYRSARLNGEYRVMYRENKNNNNSIIVKKLTKHEYTTRK